MALSRITVWTAGQILTAAALNGEFNNLLNNPLTLISPTTGNINFNSNQATNFGLEILSADPVSVTSGRVLYQNVKQIMEVDDGTIIRAIPAVPSTAVVVGDLIVSATSGAGAWKVLPVGSTGQVLSVTSTGVLGWISNLRILQVLSTGLNAAANILTTTPADVAGATLALTPTSTGSRIAVLYSGTLSITATPGTAQTGFCVLVTSSGTITPTVSMTQRVSSNGVGGIGTVAGVGWSVLTNASTGPYPTTYKIQGYADSSTAGGTLAQLLTLTMILAELSS